MGLENVNWCCIHTVEYTGDACELGDQTSLSVKGERGLFVTRTLKHFGGFCII
jgi:hypothetical protein